MVTMLGTGFTIFVCFWLLWIKLPIMTRLKALGRPFLLDLACSVGVFILYGGTGAGLAAATMAALVISINISFARKWFGYYHKIGGKWHYRVGKFDMRDRIALEKLHRRNLNAAKETGSSPAG